MTQAQIESIVCWKMFCEVCRFIGMVLFLAAIIFPTALLLSIV